MFKQGDLISSFRQTQLKGTLQFVMSSAYTYQYAYICTFKVQKKYCPSPYTTYSALKNKLSHPLKIFSRLVTLHLKLSLYLIWISDNKTTQITIELLKEQDLNGET